MVDNGGYRGGGGNFGGGGASGSYDDGGGSGAAGDAPTGGGYDGGSSGGAPAGGGSGGSGGSGGASDSGGGGGGSHGGGGGGGSHGGGAGGAGTGGGAGGGGPDGSGPGVGGGTAGASSGAKSGLAVGAARVADQVKAKLTIADTGNAKVDAMGDIFNAKLALFTEAPPPEQGALGWVNQGIQVALAIKDFTAIGQELMDTGFAMITAPLAAMMPALPAAFLTVPHLGMPHAHAHPPSLVPPAPPVPLPSIGQLMLAGSVGVLVMGMPAGRCGDLGLAVTCGSFAPAFDVFLGSSNTFIAGNRAARMGDMTRHCNPSSAALAMSRGAALFSAGVAAVGVAADAVGGGAVAGAVAQIAADLAAAAMSALLGKDPGVPPAFGALMMGAPTVLIGGFPCPNLPNPLDAMMHGLKCLGKAFAKSKAFGKLIKPFGLCNSPGEPIHPFTGEVYNDFEDYADPESGFTWGRHYRSGWNEQDGPVGYGFRHFFQRKLTVLRKRVVYETYTNEIVALPRRDDGTFEALDGFSLKTGGDAFVLYTDLDEQLFFRLQPTTPPTARLERYKTTRLDIYLFYNPAGQLRALSEFDGVQAVDTHFVYTPDGQLETVSRGPRGQAPRPVARYSYQGRCLVEHQNALGAVVRYRYDDFRRMAVATAPSGYSFRWYYDHAGRCIKSHGDDGLLGVEAKYAGTTSTFTEADGGVWTFKHYPNGGISHIVGPDGGVTQYVQDDNGRITKQIVPGGSTYTWLYDETGRHTGRLDPFGFLVPPEDEAPNPATLAHDGPTTPKGYLWGRPLNALGLALDSVPASVAACTPVPAAHGARQRTRDAMGRLTEEVLADGNVRTLVYDADDNVTAEHVGPAGSAFAPRAVGSRGGWRTRQFSSWNLLSAEASPLGHTTRYEYNHRGHWRSVTDPNGNRTDYVRDLRHRVTEVHRFGGVFRRYRYDACNSVVEEQDGFGVTQVKYENDGRGLHLKKTLVSGQTYTYAYDSHGRHTAASSDLHEIERAHSGRRITLDRRDGKGVEHAYDDKGKLLATTYFGRYKVSYAYLAGAKARITTPEGGVHRHAQSRTHLLRENGNGTREALTFDEYDRLLGRACWRELDPPFWHTTYHYGASGELLHANDSQEVVGYEYDADRRLIREHLPHGARSYSYDAAGNLLSTPEHRALRYGGDNLLESADFEHFQHDSRARLATRNRAGGAVTRYVYDSLGQLAEVQTDGRPFWRAAYDGLGRRLWREYEGQRTDFYWDEDRLAAERAPGGELRIYVYANEDALVPFMWLDYASESAPPESAQAFYLYCAPNGMPLRVENSQGAEVWRASTLVAYGGTDASCPTRLRFAGHFFDEHLGLYYNRFRDYDPRLGRYLQPDPLGLAAGINLFSYSANPLVDVDLRGLTVHKANPTPDANGSDHGQGHPDAEGADPKKLRPKGEETELVDAHGKPKKPLEEMSDEELQQFTKQRAGQINDSMHPEEAKRATVAVMVVEKPNRNEKGESVHPDPKRAVVVTSSENREPKMPNKTKDKETGEVTQHNEKGSPRDSALNDDEDFRETPPKLKKTGTEKDANGDEQDVDLTGKPGRQRDYFDEDGDPYKKANTKKPEEGGETRHHAEQRAQNSLGDDESMAGLGPSKPCCAGCNKALSDSGNLDKVHPDLRE